MKRRRFLTRGLELVIAAQCLPLLGAKASAMQLRPGTKPALTEASLNAIIPKETAGLRTLAGQMFPDMKAFIRANFTLSPEQERALAGISGATVDHIRKAVDTAITKGAKISVLAVTAPRSDTDVTVRFDHAGDLAVEGSGCINLPLRVG
jgi:hypothetical protein